MTSINIPKDDVAVRELRSKNLSSASIQPTSATTATTQTNEVGANQKAPQSRTSIRQRKKNDRRQGDRRKRHEKVLLDTRSHRERRKRSRRMQDLEQKQEQSKDQTTINLQGVDVYT